MMMTTSHTYGILRVSIKFTNRLTIKYKSPLYQTIENVIYGEKKNTFWRFGKFFPRFQLFRYSSHNSIYSNLYSTVRTKPNSRYVFISICFRFPNNDKLAIVNYIIRFLFEQSTERMERWTSNSRAIVILFSIGPWWIERSGLIMWVITRDKCNRK